jgi:hypothetical protein
MPCGGQWDHRRMSYDSSSNDTSLILRVLLAVLAFAAAAVVTRVLASILLGLVVSLAVVGAGAFAAWQTWKLTGPSHRSVGGGSNRYLG